MPKEDQPEMMINLVADNNINYRDIDSNGRVVLKEEIQAQLDDMQTRIKNIEKLICRYMRDAGYNAK